MNPIEWNLNPEIMSGLPFRYYSLFFVAGLFLGFNIAKKLFLAENYTLPQIEKLAFYILIGTIIGARLGHCLFYEPAYFLRHPLEMILPFSFEGGFRWTGYLGLASHGGILGVFLAILLWCRKNKASVLATLDKIVVGGTLTGVFIRLGNFMNSEIIGKPTGGDFGVIFRQVDDVPRHPAQLYEAAAYFVIFLIIRYLYRNKRQQYAHGFTFGVFFALLFGARFMIEFFKKNQVAFEQNMALNMGQWLSLPFVVVGVLVAVWSVRRGREIST